MNLSRPPVNCDCDNPYAATRHFASRRIAEHVIEQLYLDGNLNFEDSADVVEWTHGRTGKKHNGKRFAVIVG